mgnify:CR=1 FL=1
MKNTILITGCCGFIGFSLAVKLLENKSNIIIGIDNINSYYDPNLKKKRLKILNQNKNFVFKKFDIANFSKLSQIFKKNKIIKIFHFAAQAGVQYSLKNPRAYQNSNVNGYFNLLELSRMYQVRNIYYASSSSVYGDSKIFPVKESFNLYPKNFYGLSKKINEEMSEVFANYYEINITGLRFFTVYGPWGRPDLVILKLIDAFYRKDKFYLNNYGNHFRDFTYVSDVVDIIINISNNKNIIGNNIFNICSSNPISLKKLVKIAEKKIGKINIVKRKFQTGDILKSYGSNNKIKSYFPKVRFTEFEIGFKKTLEWYRKFNKIT